MGQAAHEEHEKSIKKVYLIEIDLGEGVEAGPQNARLLDDPSRPALVAQAAAWARLWVPRI